jgi:hypothetical protein
MVADRRRFEYYSRISFCVDDIVLLDPERIIRLVRVYNNCVVWFQLQLKLSSESNAFEYSAPLMLSRILKSNMQVSFHNLANVLFLFLGATESWKRNRKPSTKHANQKPESCELCEMNTSVLAGFLGIMGRNPTAFESNQLHVAIFWFFFISLRSIPQIPFRIIGNFPELFNFNWSFLKLHGFICS